MALMRPLGMFVVLACGTAVFRTDAQTVQPAPRFNFQGKLLVVACDTDMLPSAYIDGKLGPDVLSLIRLDQGATSPRQLHATTVEVTNSVTGPPAAVAVTPDGRYAIVAEMQAPCPANKADAPMKDLATGRKLTVVDLQDPEKPTVVQQIVSYERPVSVAINPAGTTVAVTYAAKSHSAVPLVVFPFAQGRLGQGAEPVLPGYTSSDELTDAEFLPSGVNGVDALTGCDVRLARLRGGSSRAVGPVHARSRP